MDPEQAEAEAQTQEEKPITGSYEPYPPYIPGVPAVVTPAIYAGEVASNPYFDMVKAHFDERLRDYLAEQAEAGGEASMREPDGEAGTE